MIFDHLQHSYRYEGLHPEFKKIFQLIKQTQWLEKDLGKIEINADKVFIINSEVEALGKEQQVLEYHKKYLDIHIVLKGEEIIGWKNLNDCKNEKQAFNQDDDYGLYSDSPTNYIVLPEGHFAIVFPEDAHAPIIGQGKIRKLVVKVQLI